MKPCEGFVQDATGFGWAEFSSILLDLRCCHWVICSFVRQIEIFGSWTVSFHTLSFLLHQMHQQAVANFRCSSECKRWRRQNMAKKMHQQVYFYLLDLIRYNIIYLIYFERRYWIRACDFKDWALQWLNYVCTD